MLQEVRVYEGLSEVKSVASNVQEIKRVSWKREKINRVSWIIFVQITVLFVALNNYLMYLVKRAPWNRKIFNRVPCLLTVYRVCYRVPCLLHPQCTVLLHPSFIISDDDLTPSNWYGDISLNVDCGLRTTDCQFQGSTVKTCKTTCVRVLQNFIFPPHWKLP